MPGIMPPTAPRTVLRSNCGRRIFRSALGRAGRAHPTTASEQPAQFVIDGAESTDRRVRCAAIAAFLAPYRSLKTRNDPVHHHEQFTRHFTPARDHGGVANAGRRLPMRSEQEVATIAPYTIEEAYEVRSRGAISMTWVMSSAISCCRWCFTPAWRKSRTHSISATWWKRFRAR